MEIIITIPNKFLLRKFEPPLMATSNNDCLNLVPRVLVTLVQRWSGQQWSNYPNNDLWGEAIRHDRILGLPVLLRMCSTDSWTSGLIAQVRRITLSQKSLLAAPPALDKGNEDSGNEIVTASGVISTDLQKLTTDKTKQKQKRQHELIKSL